MNFIPRNWCVQKKWLGNASKARSLLGIVPEMGKDLKKLQKLTPPFKSKIDNNRGLNRKYKMCF